MIDPFNERQLQSESYDVTIGTQLTVRNKEIFCLDISNGESIERSYQHMDIPREGYTVSPKEYVFVSIAERLKLPNNITAHLRPKTQYTRLGLWVSGQHCNSTYSGFLKIGLYNVTDYPIRIYAGYPIAQLVFEELDGAPSEEKLYKNREDAQFGGEDGHFRSPRFENGYLDAVWNKMLE